MSIITSDKTDLFPSREGLLNFDNLVRPSIEATVLHAWYINLWDCAPDDPEAWSVQTFRRIVDLDERDREYAERSQNKQVRVQFSHLLVVAAVLH